MNKQIFLSLALVVLAGFSGAIGTQKGTSIDSKNSSTSSLQVEKTVTESKKNHQEKTDASGVRAAYNSIIAFGTEHQVKIGVLLALIAAGYLTYKFVYQNCPWFKEFVDGKAEKGAQDLPWGDVLKN